MLRLALACLVLGLFAVVPTAANAASTTQILRDCADDGVLQGDYTPAELRKARQNIPTDTDQYTDCRDVIARAAAARSAGDSGPGGGGGGTGGATGGGNGGTPLTPQDDRDQAGLDDALRNGTAPIDIGGRPVVPGAVGLNAAARHELPTSVVVLLVLLAIGALAAAAPGARRAWSATDGFIRAHAPGRNG